MTPEEAQAEAGAPDERLITIPLEALAWAVVAALFALVRVWPVWEMPVGGAEFDHLAGAWNASNGVQDGRYVPTLFQALTAALLTFTTSEIPARVVAFVATMTLPAALCLLRPVLGPGGALFALLVLSVDAVGVAIGSTASALSLDLAVAVWLFVLLTRGATPGWVTGLAAFVVASAGPIPLPLVAAGGAALLLRGERPSTQLLGWMAGGAILAVVLTTLRPGLGPDGLTIAPLALFGDTFQQRWSTADGLDLLLLASWPIVLGGVGAALLHCREAWLTNALDRHTQLLLLWFAFAFGWLVTALPSHDAAAVAAATLPAALLLGPSLAHGISLLREADWTYARYLVPFAAITLSIAAFYVGDWAKLDRVGGTEDKLVVSGLVIAALAALALTVMDRRAAPSVLAILLPVAAVPLVIATATVAFRAGDAPLPSPRASAQAREIRDIALQAVESSGGSIVIHPDFEDELTWPFRDSGNVIVASRVPEEAGFLVWPAAAPAPEGFAPLEGDWSLVRAVEPPTGGLLEFLQWYTDRYSLAITSDPAAVYVKESE